MRKIIALLLVMGMLLLTACGNNFPVSSLSEAEAESVSIASAPVSETSVETTVPSDPIELGVYIWEQREQTDFDIYAQDYDMDITMELDILGESMTQRSSARIQVIDQEDVYSYHQTMTTDGTTSEVWYQDGIVYQTNSLGNYKAPISMEDFLTLIGEDSTEENNLLSLSADSFGTITGETTASGYCVTFGDVDVDTWMQYNALLESMIGDDSFTCTGFSLEGYVDTDESFMTRKIELDMTVSADLDGITEDITVHITSNGFNDAVTINVPTNDTSFQEFEDINIPEDYVNGYTLLLSQDALNYESALSISVTDGISSETYTCSDSIYYILTDTGISSHWTTTVSLDDEVVDQSIDVYADGNGTITDLTGEYPYTYDDYSTMSDISNLITYNADGFDYGSGYTLGSDSGFTTLTYDLSSEYIESIAEANLDFSSIILSEATDITSEGTMTLWFDESGMLVRQLVDCNLTLDYDGTEFHITFVDCSEVVATGSAVVMPSDRY